MGVTTPLDALDNPRQAPAVRLIDDGDDIRVYGLPYRDRHLVADLPRPARRWNPTIRCWVVHLRHRGQLAATLGDAGYHVQVVDARPSRNTALERLRRAHASSPLLRKAYAS